MCLTGFTMPSPQTWVEYSKAVIEKERHPWIVMGAITQ